MVKIQYKTKQEVGIDSKLSREQLIAKYNLRPETWKNDSQKTIEKFAKWFKTIDKKN